MAIISAPSVFSILKHSKDFVCPIGKEVLRGNHSNLDSFPPNFTLRALIEKSLEFGLCQDHKKELQFMCIDDKEKVCYECALFGKHVKHNIKPLADFKSEMENKTTKLEELLQATEKYQIETEKVYKDQRNISLSLVQSRFRDLRFILNAKEGEFISKVNSLYDKEIDELRSQIGESSLANDS